eukprot:10527640-Alexandrium_andersonii.AAC.1
MQAAAPPAQQRAPWRQAAGAVVRAVTQAFGYVQGGVAEGGQETNPAPAQAAEVPKDSYGC